MCVRVRVRVRVVGLVLAQTLRIAVCFETQSESGDCANDCLSAFVLVHWQVFGSDFLVTWFNLSCQDELFGVNLVSSWKRVNKYMGLMFVWVLFFTALEKGVECLAALCVINTARGNVLVQCSG